MSAARPKAGSSMTKAVLLIGITIALLGLAAIMAAVLLYSNVNRGGKKASPTPAATPARSVTPTPTSDDNQKLKDMVANLQQQIDERKNSKSNSVTPIASPTPDTSQPTARVNSPNDGFLSLRSEPNADYGERLAKIPHGATVQLENCEKSRTTVAGRSGRWCLVTYGNNTGYVFDAWLSY